VKLASAHCRPQDQNCAARAERARLHGAPMAGRWRRLGRRCARGTCRQRFGHRPAWANCRTGDWRSGTGDSGDRGRGIWPVGPNRAMVQRFLGRARRRPSYLYPTFAKARRRIFVARGLGACLLVLAVVGLCRSRLDIRTP
jgi:hypothetical protein